MPLSGDVFGLAGGAIAPSGWRSGL